MSSIDITFHKGLGAEQATKLQLPVDTTLEKVRKQLEEAHFLVPDQADVKYRFVQTKTKSKTDIDQRRGLVDPEYEDQLTLTKVLRRDNDGNYLVLVTNAKKKAPDYMGMATDSFVQGSLRVHVALNDDDHAAVEENGRIRAFPPLTMTDVRPADGSASNFDNVCVVVDGSIIAFSITSWAAAGYEFRIETGMGEVVTDMYAVRDDTSSGYVTIGVRGYEGSERLIKVVGETAEQILGHDRVKLQKAVIKTRRIVEVTLNDGSRHANDDHAPAHRPGPEGESALLAAFTGSGGDRLVCDVPREGVKPGGLAPARGTSGETHGGLRAVKTEDWQEASVVTVYFLVFRTWEDAKEIVGSYNAPPA
ncbi:hypothetical protein ACFXKD_13535 [Nocardiopsis aegyptia]|uniref:hypothetical protein n=1 Tax=Nocardiopsis aegyptia TaxID=220378 RepID=UPI003671A78C